MIAIRSERKGTIKWSLARAGAGKVRIHTSLLGAVPSVYAACLWVIDIFIFLHSDNQGVSI